MKKTASAPFRPLRKPEWLKIRRDSIDNYSLTADSLSRGGLCTICASGKCPNRAECWSRGTATFMLAGEVCTRACRFCATEYSAHPPALDDQEPGKLAVAVREMGLKYVVLTSVDRDDLPDYGAAHWRDCMLAVRRGIPSVMIEALIPDFNGDTHCLDVVLSVHPDVLAHNLETVRRLTPTIRHRATYERSLEVLRYCRDQGAVTKTGIMVGLGETEEEVIELMEDCCRVGVHTLTIGQYLQPTRRHVCVEEYITPSRFERYKQVGESIGLIHVESGPLVRSSYHADTQFRKAHRSLRSL